MYIVFGTKYLIIHFTFFGLEFQRICFLLHDGKSENLFTK